MRDSEDRPFAVSLLQMYVASESVRWLSLAPSSVILKTAVDRQVDDLTNLRKQGQPKRVISEEFAGHDWLDLHGLQARHPCPQVQLLMK